MSPVEYSDIPHPVSADDERGQSSLVSRRIVSGAVGTLYAALTIATYVQLSSVWAYIGFWYRPPPLWTTIFTVSLAGVLGLFLPVRHWTIVGFVKWLLYYILFIPAIVIPPQQSALPLSSLNLLTVLNFASAALLIVGLRDGRPFPAIHLSERTFWHGVFIAWGVANVLILYVFQGSLNFAGLDEVYEQRDAAGQISGPAITYIMGLTSGAINPFLLVTGMAQKKPLRIGMAIFGQILVYSTLAGKIVLGSTLLTIGIFFAFRNGRVVFNRVYIAVVLFGCAGPLVSIPRASPDSILTTISTLIYMRILVLPGVLVGVYSEFFLSNPVTHFSHSLIGRPFSTYPYGNQSIGQIIGGYVTPMSADGAVNNYVANFIAGDGIAGFGSWGIPIIFLIAAVWLWLLSRLIGKEGRPSACAILMGYVVSLGTTSLFTSILTGGGAAIGLLMFLHRSAIDSTASKVVPGRPMERDDGRDSGRQDHDIKPTASP